MISKSSAERIRDAWSEASSLKEAIGLAGLSNKDGRRNRRYRRQAEKLLGIELHAHNPKFSTYKKIECPSDLDVKAARKCKEFVVTSCTNNSPVVEPFLSALKHFAESKGAQILIDTVLYQDRKAFPKDEDYEWDDAIYPYALNSDLHVSPSLVFSSLNIRPTTVNPLSGLDDLTGKKSAIFGHPQLAMKPIATPKVDLPKMIMTTGSINRPRYSDTTAGGKGEHHHSISALYIKVVGSKFYPIQLQWKNHCFYFLDEKWTSEGLESENVSCEAVVLKDAHAAHEDKKVTDATMRLLSCVRPPTLVWHDLYDHYSQSHHHDRITRIRIAEEGRHLVKEEIGRTVKMMERIGEGKKNLIVDSNHHDHLDRWVNEFNPDKDPHNARYHAYLLSCMLESGDGAMPCAFRDAATKTILIRKGDEFLEYEVDFEFLDPNRPHLIKDIDVSQHGHRGANGARGSAKAISKTHYKTIIGHVHSPYIEKGCWACGVWSVDLAYAIGLSSWMPTDTIIYPNGARAHIYYIGNKSIADL